MSKQRSIDRVRVHWLLALTLVAWACARIPATVETQVQDEPAAPEVAPPELERARVVGTQEEREIGRFRLQGVWIIEGEVWDIAGDEARVYRPREQDVVVERRIEMIAPCMFIAFDPGQDDVIGPFVLHRWFWTTAPSVVVKCRASEVNLWAGKICEAWRFDREQRAFELLDCPPPSTDVPPSTEVAEEKQGPVEVHNLASACSHFGCTRGQAQQLVDDYWAADDGTCSGAALHLDLTGEWPNEGVTVSPECLVDPPRGTPLFELGEGIALVEQPKRVRPGDWVELEFMFENTATQTQTLRLPYAEWTFLVSRDGKPIPMDAACRSHGSPDPDAVPHQAIEFRLEPGGTLEFAVPWTAVEMVGEEEEADCRFRPLRRGAILVGLEMGGPDAVVEKTIHLEGKPSCDPCPDPWDIEW